MSIDDDIDSFLAGSTFAVAGASQSRRKYGNKVLRCYRQHGRRVFPVNPNRTTIEGEPCYARLRDLPEGVHGVSLITQPTVSATVVDEALELGVRHFWFQPGAEHAGAIERARAAGAVVIGNGPCLLVVLGYDDAH
jgi:predicted CoA-binding protein